MQTDTADTVIRSPKIARMEFERVPLLARKRGAKHDYHPQLVSELAELTAAGWTDTEVAAELGVPRTTLYRWKLAHADFAAAMAVNTKNAVERVAGTLYSLANGYSYVEQEAHVVKTGQHTEELRVIDVVKHVAPNPGSAIFYLKNRDPANWRDVQDLNVQGSVKIESGDVRALALALLATIQAGLASPVIEGTINQEQVKNDD